MSNFAISRAREDDFAQDVPYVPHVPRVPPDGGGEPVETGR